MYPENLPADEITPEAVLWAVLRKWDWPESVRTAVEANRDLAARAVWVCADPLEAMQLVVCGMAGGGRSMVRNLVEIAERLPQEGSPMRNLGRG